MGHRLILSALLATTAVAPSLNAQTDTLATGRKIQIWTVRGGPPSFEGWSAGATEDSVWWVDRKLGTLRSVPRRQVRDIKMSRGKRVPMGGAPIGFGVGAALGVWAWVACSHSCDGEVSTRDGLGGTLLGGIMGAGVGFLIGLPFTHERWAPVIIPGTLDTQTVVGLRWQP